MNKKFCEVLNDIYDYNNFIKTFKSIKTITFKGFMKDILKFIIILIFFPVIILLKMFENKNFSRILKQIVTFMYFIFFLIFIYSLFTYKSYNNKYKNIKIDVPFLDKLKDIE